LPDFFKGEPIPTSIDPPDTDEKKKMVADFMARNAKFGEYGKMLGEVMKEAKGKYGKVEKWGTHGLCWVGIIAAFASAEETGFMAAGTAHPG